MDKTLFGIMAILFNGLGVPSFLLGKTKQGVIHIILTVGLSFFGIGIIFEIIFFVYGLMAGIKALQMSQEEFEKEKDNLKISFIKA